MQWSRWNCPILLAVLCSAVSGSATAQVESLRYYVDYVSVIREELALPPQPSSEPVRMPGPLRRLLGLDIDGAEIPEEVERLSIGRFTPGKSDARLEFIKRGDPGELGYSKTPAPVPILDLGPTNLRFALKGSSSSGNQNSASDGPPKLSPALALSHDLGDGASLQGSVGQQMGSNPKFRDLLQNGFRYSLAVQHPVPFLPNRPEQGLFLTVQALGEYHIDGLRADGKTSTWDIIPGLQYRLNNACWMSVGMSRTNFFSWTWQY